MTAVALSCDRSLRDDALAIWQAAVEAVDSERLVRRVVHRAESTLSLCGHEFDAGEIRRVAVVGGGKAGAGMAAGFEAAVGDEWLRQKVDGWINVPDDCVRPLNRIHLHPARQPGVNEPTPEGVAGAERILELVANLGPRDVCVVLLSGGGSALLPAPAPGITLDDKLKVTRLLSRAGARIDELNCVRRQLSRIKGGGLARACRAGTLISLIISDVVGDPLETIASGPTAAANESRADALKILRRHLPEDRIPERVLGFLQHDPPETQSETQTQTVVFHHVIGNNRLALDAAARQAREMGCDVHDLGSDQTGVARDVGEALARECLDLRSGLERGGRPVCLLSGGEPVVHVVETPLPQKGGRNQELVLAAVAAGWEDGLEGIALLSGGTDGEDGPTDAAGAVADAALIARAKQAQLHPGEFLARNNSYPFFEQTGGLIRTGPTHTNVMDVRVALIRPA